MISFAATCSRMYTPSNLSFHRLKLDIFISFCSLFQTFFRILKLDTVLEYSIPVSQWKDCSATRRKFKCAIKGALAFVGIR